MADGAVETINRAGRRGPWCRLPSNRYWDIAFGNIAFGTITPPGRTGSDGAAAARPRVQNVWLIIETRLGKPTTETPPQKLHQRNKAGGGAFDESAELPTLCVEVRLVNAGDCV
jgi:hypothetical protein